MSDIEDTIYADPVARSRSSSRSSSTESDSNPKLRPNTWTGQPQKWQALTAKDRDVVVSLDRERDADLGVHLFNAHKLRQRAGILGRDRYNPLKDEYPDIPVEEQIFKPRRDWTAWPLPPDEVPRTGLFNRGDCAEDTGTYKKRQRIYPSTELEDVLTGITLKFAGQRFKGREAANLEEEEREEDDFIDLSDDDYESGDGEHHDYAPRRNMVPAIPQPFLEPVVSADDERSWLLLKPNVRNTMARLDEVLMALHHARKTCRRYEGEEDTDEEEQERSVVGSAANISPKKLVGRPRKFEGLADTSIVPIKDRRGRKKKEYPRLPDETEQEYQIRIAKIQKRPLPSFAPKLERKQKKAKEIPESELDTELDAEAEREREDGANVKKRRGRKKKEYTRLPDEPQTVYLLRIARMQKKVTRDKAKADRAAELATEAENNPGASPSKKNVKNKDLLESLKKRKLKPRDWSEVLGSAALVGVSEAVIERATQRCADLFGEGMVMRNIVEAPYGAEHSVFEKSYQPEAIPDLDEITSGDETGVSSDASETQAGGRRTADGRRRKAPVWATTKSNIRCPMPECVRRAHQQRYFKHNAALKKHLAWAHEIPEKELNDYILPSDDETEGAVHVDGFLKPVRRFKRFKRFGEEEEGVEIKSEDEGNGEGVGGERGSSVVEVDEHGEEIVLGRGGSEKRTRSLSNHSAEDEDGEEVVFGRAESGKRTRSLSNDSAAAQKIKDNSESAPGSEFALSS